MTGHVAKKVGFDQMDMPRTVWRLANSGRTRFLFHQYGVAHVAFGEALALKPPADVRSVLLSCYATSGYLSLAQASQDEAAVEFLKSMRDEHGPDYDKGYEEMLRFLRGD